MGQSSFQGSFKGSSTGTFKGAFQGTCKVTIWGLLGCSGFVISGAISKVTVIITQIRGLLTPLITTLNPQSLNPEP